MKQLKRLSFVLLGVVVLLLVASPFPGERTRAVAVQESTPAGDLTWTRHGDGFAGVYTFQKQNFAIESYQPSPDFALTRILKPGGSNLIEVLRNNQTVILTLAEARVSFDVGDSSTFTRDEQADLQNALDSVDALVARRVVAGTIFQLKRKGVERKLLVGLGVASIVLGGEPKVTRFDADTSRLLSAVVPEECAAFNCLGCCGSGCIGCIGCCTEACRRHDECVRQFGQLRCLFLLPAAIASVFFECL